MVYEPGQVERIFPDINFEPKWFILGGPADANEAQVFHRHYPKAKIIGIEPSKEAYAYQQAAGFPGVLLDKALSNTSGPGVLRENRIRGSWLVHERVSEGIVDEDYCYPIETTTLDQLDVEYGPFNGAVLWLDIEGSEWIALEGASGLLRRADGILLINLEIIETTSLGIEVELNKFSNLLAGFGYELVHKWNCGALYDESGNSDRYRRDVVFRKVSLPT